MATEPDAAPPVEKPVPVQAVACELPHASVQEAPCSTGFGVQLREAVGTRTETDAFAEATPPGPAHESEYDVSAPGAT